jgi:UBX domain-containing protein 6
VHACPPPYIADAAAAVAAIDREARPAEQAAALALARRKAAAAAAAAAAVPPPSPPHRAAASSSATAAPAHEDNNTLLARGSAAATATGADVEAVAALQAALTQVLSTAAGKVAAADSVALMARVLRNVVSEPTNVKFRRLRLSNAKVQATVMDVPGALELLQAAGFCMLFEDAPDDAEGASEGWLVLPEADPHAFTCARAGLALLEPFVTPTPPAATAAAAASPVVQFGPSNRQTRTFAPADRCAAAFFNPSDAFFRHTADEVRAAAAAAKVKLEESRQLTTRAYKEAQAAERRGKPTSATIRVRLPDGIILQGSFAATETVTAVCEWVWEQLAAPDAFELFEAGAQHPVADLHPACSDGAPPRPRTVADAGLAPSSLLNLKWKHEHASRPGEACLHRELMASVEPLE